MRRLAPLLISAVLLLASQTARADITIGAILSLTGPAASLGIPARNIIDMLPREAAGQKLRYVILDDATDSTAAKVQRPKASATEDIFDRSPKEVYPQEIEDQVPEAAMQELKGQELPDEALLKPAATQREQRLEPAPQNRLVKTEEFLKYENGGIDDHQYKRGGPL
jgi:hypothetical protein